MRVHAQTKIPRLLHIEPGTPNRTVFRIMHIQYLGLGFGVCSYQLLSWNNFLNSGVSEGIVLLVLLRGLS